MFRVSVNFWKIILDVGYTSSVEGETGSFNNWIVLNLLFCAYHFNNASKIILLEFCFLFVVTVCVLFRKCLNVYYPICI